MTSPLNKKQTIGLQFFLTRALFLGEGLSIIGSYSKADSWICIILGFLMGFIFIYLFDKIGKKINYNMQNLFLNKFGLVWKIVFFLLYIILLSLTTFTFSNFIKSFYLINTPIWLIICVIYVTIYYVSRKNEITLGKFCEMFTPISCIFSFFVGSLLIKYSHLSNFLPILNNGTLDLIKSTIIFTILSVLPSIMLIDNKESLKTKLIGYSLGCFSIFFVNFFETLVLGGFYMNIYSYPEYMVLKKIKLLNFIENIDKICSLVWYFDMLVFMSYTLIKIKHIFHKKRIKKLCNPLILIFLLIITSFIVSNNFVILMFIYNNVIYILFGFLLLISIGLFIFLLFTKSNEKCI